jgi:heptosyltransferase-2
MGDVVLQTATVNWLKALMGESLKITFVTSQEFSSLVDQHPSINHVLSFNRRGESWTDFKKKIKQFHQTEPIDLILDLHSTLRSLRLRFALWKIPCLSLDKRRFERFLLTKIKGQWLKKILASHLIGNENQVERIITDFQELFNDSRGFRRAIDWVNRPHHHVTTLAKTEKVLEEKKYIVIAPSASFESKRWPIEKFVDLAEKIITDHRIDIKILAGPDDHFCKAFNRIQSPLLHNLQGKTSLRESMFILSQASFCIGNDSGINHIAEAYGVSCLTLFGPTDPCFGFAPHGKSSGFISKDMWCKPCSTTGSHKCFRDSHYCMNEISVAEVYSKYLALGHT